MIFDIEKMDPKVIKKIIKEEKKSDSYISQLLSNDKKERRYNITILILGASESGKSTVSKQFRLFNNFRYTEEESISFKEVVIQNLCTSIRSLVHHIQKVNASISDENQNGLNDLLNLISENEINSDVVSILKSLLGERSVNKLLRDRSSMFPAYTKYYFGNVDRIAEPEYIPTELDIVWARKPTHSVIETVINVDKIKIKLVDVAGQKTKRKKWIHFFDGVDAVIFCVDLSGYDLRLAEDPNVNRMRDSLELFNNTINSEHFANIDIILFLNKRDIFENKLQKVPLNACFADYEGEDELEEAVNYIIQQFLKYNHNESRKVHVHVTCATDTENMSNVLAAVQSIIVNNSLALSGLVVTN